MTTQTKVLDHARNGHLDLRGLSATERDARMASRLMPARASKLRFISACALAIACTLGPLILLPLLAYVIEVTFCPSKK